MTDETQEQQITAVGNEMSASFLAAKKRSDETLAAIEKNPGKFTMLTGQVVRMSLKVASGVIAVPSVPALTGTGRFSACASPPGSS